MQNSVHSWSASLRATDLVVSVYDPFLTAADAAAAATVGAAAPPAPADGRLDPMALGAALGARAPDAGAGTRDERDFGGDGDHRAGLWQGRGAAF